VILRITHDLFRIFPKLLPTYPNLQSVQILSVRPAFRFDKDVWGASAVRYASKTVKELFIPVGLEYATMFFPEITRLALVGWSAAFDRSIREITKHCGKVRRVGFKKTGKSLFTNLPVLKA
jgi:hypothetical protein